MIILEIYCANYGNCVNDNNTDPNTIPIVVCHLQEKLHCEILDLDNKNYEFCYKKLECK